MMTLIRNVLRNKKGQSLVEYGILVGAIAIVCLAATAILGHKVNDLIGTSAAILPGAHADDNGAIFSGKLVNTTSAEDGSIGLDTTGTSSIEGNLGINGISSLVTETPPTAPVTP